METIENRLKALVTIVEGTRRGAQSDFSKKIGCSRGIFSTWIKGKAIPSPEYREKIKIAYNVNIDWLMTGNGEIFLEEIIEIKPYVRRLNSLIDESNEISTSSNDDFLVPLCSVFISDGKIHWKKQNKLELELPRTSYKNEIAYLVKDEEAKYFPSFNNSDCLVTLIPSRKQSIKTGRIYTFIHNDEIVFKEVFNPKDGYFLISDYNSKNYEVIKFDDNVQIFEVIPKFGEDQSNNHVNVDKGKEIFKKYYLQAGRSTIEAMFITVFLGFTLLPYTYVVTNFFRNLRDGYFVAIAEFNHQFNYLWLLLIPALLSLWLCDKVYRKYHPYNYQKAIRELDLISLKRHKNSH